ncbi:hypothetical protein [Aliikangiella sp. G2MR2-5]|nr:hypothetical protein [Aliikangiella sp. G2MR2-5]
MLVNKKWLMQNMYYRTDITEHILSHFDQTSNNSPETVETQNLDPMALMA